MKSLTAIIMLSMCVMFLTATLCAAQDSPSAEYLKYVAAISTARSIKDLTPFISAPKLKELDAMPPSQQEQCLKFMQTVTAKNVKVDSEKIEGNRATLAVSGTDACGGGPTTGTVLMVKENGTWKLEKENWTTTYH